ncbi:50S ribosomal protein L35 [Candidatus Gracilibacteria bacterium]|nr:50S ribosomal protein L35 [Candidatus Gracilibacteria bacterium]
MLKTRSAVKKRVKVTGSGKLLISHGSKRHLLSDKSKKAKNRNKYGVMLDGVEKKKVKEQLPFA